MLLENVDTVDSVFENGTVKEILSTLETDFT